MGVALYVCRPCRFMCDSYEAIRLHHDVIHRNAAPLESDPSIYSREALIRWYNGQDWGAPELPALTIDDVLDAHETLQCLACPWGILGMGENGNDETN